MMQNGTGTADRYGNLCQSFRIDLDGVPLLLNHSQMIQSKKNWCILVFKIRSLPITPNHCQPMDFSLGLSFGGMLLSFSDRLLRFSYLSCREVLNFFEVSQWHVHGTKKYTILGPVNVNRSQPMLSWCQPDSPGLTGSVASSPSTFTTHTQQAVSSTRIIGPLSTI